MAPNLPLGQMQRARWPRIGRIVFWLIAGFYAYGALVHVLNMLSMTGFDWPSAPRKWQVLDVVYLILDVIVVVGLLAGSRIGIAAFFTAALSQIALYTLFRGWVLDVPDAFQRSVEEIGYLDTLVLFHTVTCLVMLAALFARSRVRVIDAPGSS